MRQGGFFDPPAKSRDFFLTLVNSIKTTPAPFRILACLAAFCALRLNADVIETSNGARIVGKILLIHGGVITLSTDYAGDINIKQSLVTSIVTDHPVAIRVASGLRVVGILSAPSAGNLRVTGPTGTYDTPLDKVAVSWAAGREDPDVIAARRKWSYEAGVDVTGSKGTHTQLGTSYDFRAKLTGPNDVFQYYTAYTRQETDSQVSADQFKAGVDYADNFTELTSWYVRDEGGFDRVNLIDFSDIAAGGLGYDFIKAKEETFTGRVGLSYRFDEYAPQADTSNLSSVGGDFGLEYSKKFSKALLTDSISFDPAFQNLNNYIITHDFTFDIPLLNPNWKLSFGVANNYNSKPVSGVSKLETLYFTRLVLTWGVK
jgi:hypothetical protein